MIKRAFIVCSLIVLALAIGAVILEHVFLEKLFWHGELKDSQDFALWLKSFGPWAVIISIIVMIVQTIATPVPLFLVAGANGFIFGVSWGIIITMAGALLGSSIAFYLARFTARDHFAHYLTKYVPHIGSMSRLNCVKMIFLARLVPVLPSSVVSYAAGLSKVSFAGFFLASVFGKLPEIVVYTILGHSLEKAEGLTTKITVLLVLASLLFFSLQRKKTNNC